MDTPVAPIGCPLALSPPDGLTGRRPSRSVQPSLTARAPSPGAGQAHGLVFDQLGDGEAIVRLDEGQIVEPDAGLPERPPPRLRATLERHDVALRHRQEVLHVRRGAEGHRPPHLGRDLPFGDDEGRGAIGDERAIGPLQGSGHERVLVRFLPAEREAEILAHLRVRIADAVLVVLGGDHGERIGLVAVPLEVGGGDLAEDAGETARRVAVLRQVGGLEEVLADLGARRRRHLLDPDDERDAGAAGFDGLDGPVHGGRAGGAGVLDARRRLEAQRLARLQDERRR